jgi:hypothetical protein
VKFNHPFSYSNLAKIIFTCLFIILCTGAGAQVFPEKNYPKNYFRWPLNLAPGLAANFGELRPNHYHMGLDCKTDKKVNQVVVAAADGYIAKVKVEPYGFGQAIYINHPNGLTTLYAHLNSFYPELEKYITEQQYKQQQWHVFLDLPANLFPVTKGQFIALSGNTGGSQGPHVHFEIRDTKTDKVLNPLLFDFPIPDTKAPDIFRLAVYDRCISVYEQSPKFYPLRKVNGVYQTNPPLIIANTDKLSFAISAADSYNGNNNKNGIYEAILYENESPVVGFEIDSISYTETRDLNAHIDYKLRSGGGPFVQHLSRLPGYNNGIYKEITGSGVIVIEDDSIHHIKVEVKDANGNSSILKFDVKRGQVKNETPAVDSLAYFQQKEFHPGFINVFENDKIQLYLNENSLYDSIRFKYAELVANVPNAVSPAFLINSGTTPVHGYFPVRIKGNVDPSLNEKIVMHRYWGSNHDYAKGVFENGWFKSGFREFGYFQLIIDTNPPVINPVGFKEGMTCSKQSRIAFVILDNTEEIKVFRALLDGQWLKFSNDKGRTFVYNLDEHCAPGEHELKIYAEDQVGNSVEKVYHFKAP